MLAKGRPELIPELTYSLTGIKAEIGAIVWLGGNVQHAYTPDGYTTSLELTSQLPDGDALTSDASAGYTGALAWYRDDKTGEGAGVAGTNPKRLTHLYASKASAERAVKREWRRMQA